MTSVEFLVKLRDAATMIADACNERLEKMAPPETKWNPEKIKWCQAEGARGPYERYPEEGKKAEATDEYRNMLSNLKEHGGKLTREGYFFWVFSDGATVGRKKARK